MDAAIRCQNLSKRYGDVQALDNLDLSVAAGSIFGFLGRNGAGKTTTIRLLTGLAHATAGAAWVNGVETTAVNGSARRQFGYLPQDPAFYTWMTGREYLRYVADLFLMGKTEREQRIDEMLDLVGLTDAAKRPIRGYSGGMLQRLGIAQAMIHRPSVLFLDEPTSALDPAGRYEVLTLIETLRGRVTVFLSSHILGDVERICDTIGIIQNGRLLTVESRDELLGRFANNTVLLDVARDSLTHLPALVTALEAAPWAAGISRDDNRLHVTVTDPHTAKAALLPLVVQHNLILNKYEWTRPSLEDIFLQISAA